MALKSQPEIVVESRRKKIATLRQTHGQIAVVDVTSKSFEPWLRFSPFFPHGGIPVPFSPGFFSMSVEGLWQGLKVFEDHGIDLGRMMVTNMKGLKRTVRKYGKVLGHARGVSGHEPLLAYIEARKALYLPSYQWVIDHKLQTEMDELYALSQRRKLVLLDYETNGDVNDASKPLSHAALVREALMQRWRKDDQNAQ